MSLTLDIVKHHITFSQESPLLAIKKVIICNRNNLESIMSYMQNDSI